MGEFVSIAFLTFVVLPFVIGNDGDSYCTAVWKSIFLEVSFFLIVALILGGVNE